MITITIKQASALAESCLRINHLNTLVQREIAEGNHVRAKALSERARVRAWQNFNVLLRLGAKKPKGFCEPDAV
ncbi:MAG: hypothetical protein WCV00_20915 [Verrucomicrobiia bacterium]|jgi:hypothetical protein